MNDLANATNGAGAVQKKDQDCDCNGASAVSKADQETSTSDLATSKPKPEFKQSKEWEDFLTKKLKYNASSDRCPVGHGWIDLPSTIKFNGPSRCLFLSINERVNTWYDAMQRKPVKIKVQMNGENTELNLRFPTVFTAGHRRGVDR